MRFLILIFTSWFFIVGVSTFENVEPDLFATSSLESNVFEPADLETKLFATFDPETDLVTPFGPETDHFTPFDPENDLFANLGLNNEPSLTEPEPDSFDEMEPYIIWPSEDDLGLDANLLTAEAVGCDVSNVDNTQSFDEKRRGSMCGAPLLWQAEESPASNPSNIPIANILQDPIYFMNRIDRDFFPPDQSVCSSQIYGKSNIPDCDTYNAYRLPSAGDTEALDLGGVNICTFMTFILNLVKLLIKCVLYKGNEDNQCPKNTAYPVYEPGLWCCEVVDGQVRDTAWQNFAD
jgi:hypothetical protein